jgi:hypothetical protein
MDTFGNGSDLKEDIIPKKNERLSCPSKKEWIIIILSLGLITFTGILLIFLSKNSSNKKEDLVYSEIICLYNIIDCSHTIQILSEEYENIDDSILSIVVNETKIDYIKNYTFSDNGTYLIKYQLNKKINMDYMFKNIFDLEEVDISSEKNDMILSMNSVFEGCINLRKVTLNGFNTEQLNSTSKLFFNSGINSIKYN